MNSYIADGNVNWDNFFAGQFGNIYLNYKCMILFGSWFFKKTTVKKMLWGKWILIWYLIIFRNYNYFRNDNGTALMLKTNKTEPLFFRELHMKQSDVWDLPHNTTVREA